MKRLVLALPALCAACVTQGTYDQLKAQDDALKAEHDKTVQTLAQRDHQVLDLKDAVAKEQANARSLGDRIAKMQLELEKANADLASTLKDKSSLKSSIEDMKAALADAQKRKAAAEERIAEFRSLLGRFKSLIDAGKLRVRMIDGRMVVELATDILFASGSANLSKEGKAAIADVTGVLASIPNRSFQIEGHTDNVPTNGAHYHSNWELASARALTVLHTMIDSGMPPERISASSYGDSRPAKPNDSPENKAANRRIEIVVVPDLSGLPGFDELNRAGAS